MSVKRINSLKDVFENGLCTRCGSCVGLSGGAIKFADRTGRYVPEFTGELPDEMADRIWAGCSAKEVSFPELSEFIFGKEAKSHPYLGCVKTCNIGFSNSPELRTKCSSGGIITSVLIQLLEHGDIQGAVVTGMNPSEPWLTKSYIATSRSEIIDAAQSKYIITSTNEILPEIEMERSGDKEKDILVNTQKIQDVIEQMVRKYPEQWLWVHRRWKTRPPGEPPLHLN